MNDKLSAKKIECHYLHLGLWPLFFDLLFSGGFLVLCLVVLFSFCIVIDLFLWGSLP